MIKEDDILSLAQFGKSLEEAGIKLEEAFNKKDYANFNKAKKTLLQIQKKISEVINDAGER
jgi:exonuclease VII small subunit